MKDNLSIVITIIILVLLMVIFPLYNFFERQDDMSYNLVLKATTNFADQVMNNGYIDQNMYDKFVTELANTGNVYDIQIEAHRKVLTNAGTDKNENMTYTEQSYIDYNDDIFNAIETTSSSDLMKKSLKNNIYLLNPKDEIYVKVKNSNTTMAGSLFNTIIPASKKERIQVYYGGIIKNNAWKSVDATYTGHNLAPSSPSITLNNSSNTDIKKISNTPEKPYYEISKNDLVDNGYKITANSTSYEGRSISKYIWTITEEENSSKTKKPTDRSNQLQEIGDFIEEGKNYIIDVYAVDTAGYGSDTTSVKITIKSATNPLPETDMLGDLSNDSVLNNEDIDILKEFINGTKNPSITERNKADINKDGLITKEDLDYLEELVENGYILGDVNNDNNVNIVDMILINKYIVKSIDFTDEQIKRADFNKNGKIDDKDVGLIHDKIAAM